MFAKTMAFQYALADAFAEACRAGGLFKEFQIGGSCNFPNNRPRPGWRREISRRRHREIARRRRRNA